MLKSSIIIFSIMSFAQAAQAAKEDAKADSKASFKLTTPKLNIYAKLEIILNNYISSAINQKKTDKDLAEKFREECISMIKKDIEIINAEIQIMKNKIIQDFTPREKIIFYMWVIFSILDGHAENYQYLPYWHHTNFDLFESLYLINQLYNGPEEEYEDNDKIWLCFPKRKGAEQKILDNKRKIKTLDEKPYTIKWIEYDNLQKILDHNQTFFNVENLYAFE